MTFQAIARRLMFASALFGLVASASAQRVDGQVYSQVYGLENSAADQQWDFYEGISLRFRPAGMSGTSFKTHVRLARRGDPGEWDEKVYNAYVDFRKPGSQFAFRAGRQFMYRGVITGSLDALSVEAFPVPELNVQVIGGFATPYDKALDVQSWDEGGVLGAYANYRVTPTMRAAASYFSRRRGGELAWQQAGGALNGVVNSVIYYQAQLEWNLASNNLQGMRYRVMYAPSQWTFSGEFSSQNPRLYEDSFFNIFEIEGFNQIRAGTSYRMRGTEVGVLLVHTMFAEDWTGDEVFATVSTRPVSVGVVYKSGDGGDNFGVFGNAEFDLLDNLSARVSSSYYSYTRRSVSFSEDATAFSGGFKFQPVPLILLQAELQQSMNSAFKDDLRVFIRASYLIGK